MNLGPWNLYTRSEFKDEEAGIYIVPPSWLSRHSRNKKIFKVFATGWKRNYFYCDAILHISDHADWSGVLSLIEKVQPEKIYTLHGDGQHLKKHFEGSQVPVTLLSHKS